MRHLASPTGAGPLAAADAVGESGSAACGDLVRRVAESLGTQERAAFLRDTGYGDS